MSSQSLRKSTKPMLVKEVATIKPLAPQQQRINSLQQQLKTARLQQKQSKINQQQAKLNQQRLSK